MGLENRDCQTRPKTRKLCLTPHSPTPLSTRIVLPWLRTTKVSTREGISPDGAMSGWYARHASAGTLGNAPEVFSVKEASAATAISALPTRIRSATRFRLSKVVDCRPR